MSESTSKSGLAIAGLVIGIIAVLLSPIPIINNFAFLLAVFALIFGLVGLIKTKHGKKRGRGIAITAVVLAAVAGVVVLASQSFYGKVIDETGKEVSKELNKATGNSTEELLKNDVTVVFGAFSATTNEINLTSSSLPVTITNKNKEKKSYTIQVEAVDKAGARIADDTIYVNDLNSGQTQNEKAFEFVESGKVEALKAATFKVVTVSQT